MVRAVKKLIHTRKLSRDIIIHRWTSRRGIAWLLSQRTRHSDVSGQKQVSEKRGLGKTPNAVREKFRGKEKRSDED